MVDIQHTDLTGSGQLHPPLAKTFTGAAASYTPDNADELVVKTDVTPHILYRTTGVLAGDVVQIGSVAIESQDEGGSLTTETTTFNFVGAGVTATESLGVVTVTIPGGGGSAVEVQDEGVSLTTGVTLFNFVGAGVTATEPIADQITVTVPGNPLEVSDEGVSLTTSAVELDFVGAGVTATESAGVVTVTIPGGGSALEVEDEGVSLSTAVTKINFAGTGVTATEPVADEILVTIPGGGGSPVEVQDEGVSLTTNVGLLNFVGAGVTATEPVADQITVTVPGDPLEVSDEGVSLTADAVELDFVGAGVTATEAAGVVTVTIPGGGSALEVEDEGVSLSTAVTKLNFVGSGVTATEPVADEIEISIPGGGGGGAGGGAWEFVATQTVGVNQATVDFTGLSGEDTYYFIGNFVVDSALAAAIGVNADTTVANYNTLRNVTASGSSTGFQTLNGNRFADLVPTLYSESQGIIKRLPDGTVRIHTFSGHYTGASTRQITETVIDYPTVIADITEINFFTLSNNYAPSTEIHLYKLVTTAGSGTLDTDDTYANGDRTVGSLITVTQSGNFTFVEGINRLIDEGTPQADPTGTTAAAGDWIQFELDTAQQITAAWWSMDRPATSSSIVWQASNDAISWRTVSEEKVLQRTAASSFTGDNEVPISWKLEATEPYLYYRLVLTGGSFSLLPRYGYVRLWKREVV